MTRQARNRRAAVQSSGDRASKGAPRGQVVGLCTGAHAMWSERIETNPDVLLGKPIVRGTRVGVEAVLRKLAEGATELELLDAYPKLTREDIQACLAYAADAIAHEVTILPKTG
jgi:uncharacterized protein (DUF433 family)